MTRWILRLRLLTLAAWLYDVYRLLVKPRTRGALVALWCQGRVLLVQASYRRELSLPCGWIDRNEAPEQAARRELFEELGGTTAGEVCAAVGAVRALSAG
jgi:ADP-ribose pyrophosphatase YjhB (NUDIX family)